MTTLGDKAFEKAMRMAMPTGTMLPFAGTTVPEGWLLCNGANVSRTVYANLFAAIGTRWGSGDGSTTFTLPNCDSRFLEGTTDASKVGTYLEAGLPNITGALGAGIVYSNYDAATGAIYRDAYQVIKTVFGGSGAPNCYVGFGVKASLSNATYSAASTVQPASAQTLIIIKV